MFDPNATYQWKGDSIITLSGVEFSALLHTLKEVLETPKPSDLSFATMAAMGNCYNMLSLKLKNMVDEGQAQQPQEEPSDFIKEMMADPNQPHTSRTTKTFSEVVEELDGE